MLLTQQANDKTALGTSTSSIAKAFETTVENLQEFIIEHAMEAGDVLPSERELSQRFRVSRHTLREAIRVLQEKGVLVTKRGSGTYVAAKGKHSLSDELLALMPSEYDRLQEIFQIREIIEPQAAALAATMVGPENIQELRQIIAAQLLATTSIRQKELDSRFHVVLAFATKNQLLADIVEKINFALEPARSRHHHTKTRRLRSIEGHSLIVDALEQGDSGKAATAMRNHIGDVSNAVFGGADHKPQNR